MSKTTNKTGSSSSVANKIHLVDRHRYSHAGGMTEYMHQYIRYWHVVDLVVMSKYVTWDWSLGCIQLSHAHSSNIFVKQPQ